MPLWLQPHMDPVGSTGCSLGFPSWLSVYLAAYLGSFLLVSLWEISMSPLESAWTTSRIHLDQLWDHPSDVQAVKVAAAAVAAATGLTTQQLRSHPIIDEGVST